VKTAALTVLTQLMLVAAAMAQPGTDLAGQLQRAGRLTPEELTAIEQGTVAAHIDPDAADGEVTIRAAVKVASPLSRTLDYYERLVAYVDGQVTQGFGTFSAEPSPADVATLTLTAEEIQTLRTCKPGDCDLRLGTSTLAQFRTSIDWKAPDAADRVQRAARLEVLNYVRAYRQRGNEALVTYGSSSKPVSVKAQWTDLISRASGLQQTAPELRRYLEEFPQAKPAGATDILYWTRENSGLKPVVSIVHGVIYRPPGAPGQATVAQKQIYASHYFDASLALLYLFEAQVNGRPFTYVVYVNRSRGDLLRGALGGVRRRLLREQALTAARETLGVMKSSLER
jgi:hypothetical protein